MRLLTRYFRIIRVAQAASLRFAAACREFRALTDDRIPLIAVRQAAEQCRLAACATRNLLPDRLT